MNREPDLQSVPSRPVAVDLFSGVGGMSLGFEQAGFDVLVAVDSDPVHLGVHSYNFPLGECVCDDITNVTAGTIQAAARKAWPRFGRMGEWDGQIDCLFGGPSCQGFSYMGRQDAADHRNALIHEFARLVVELEPKSFVIENVPGLASPNHRETVQRLYEQLEDAGYTMQGKAPLRLDAAEHGVPQWRKRVFVIGAKEGVQIPVPTRYFGPTVRDALGDLPEVEDHSSLRTEQTLLLDQSMLTAMESVASSYATSLRSPYGYEYEREWDPGLLSGCQRTAHNEHVRQRFAALGPGQEDKPSRTRRLDPNGKSRTLRAGTGRDHGSFTAPRPIHYMTPRVITIREAARLHSFPDWFQFHATKWHGLREIGNAVPPRLAEAIAAEVIGALGVTVDGPDRRLSRADTGLLSMSMQVAADYFGLSREMLPKDVRRQSVEKDAKPKRLIPGGLPD